MSQGGRNTIELLIEHRAGKEGLRWGRRDGKQRVEGEMPEMCKHLGVMWKPHGVETSWNL